MSGLGEVFDRCAAANRTAFIPYLTGGDPTLPISAELLDALVGAGADIIEIGVPFSDPIADGPVNQRSVVRALTAGTTLSGILELVASHRTRSNVPIVLFSYFNPIFVRGVDEFARQAAASGVDGLLCVDLPPAEARRELLPALRAAAIDSIFLLSPTSTRDRVREIAEVATGFVYYVSRTGVTGVQETLESELERRVKRLRRRLEQPVAVGFGISSPAQVARVSRFADGVVVGSRLVQVVEERRDEPDLVAAVGEMASRLREATDRSWRPAKT